MRRIGALIWKDLTVEFRGREFVGAMAVFALITIVTLNFAFDLSGEQKEASGAGGLWIAFLFAAMLGLGRSLAIERERGTLEALTLCPIDGGVIFAGKLISNVLFIAVVQAISLPVFAALYDLPALSPMVLAIAIAGSLGIAGLGTLFSALVSTTRAREILMPLLLFPLAIPVVIATVQATTLELQGNSGDAWPWFNLIVVFDVIFVTMSYLLFDVVLED
ncbi:MAG TPA: heme exporter protein CcmB [Thermomicrobiales bacterium]|nr:heme exporter protein CcmB [Thermomicrobiales bacterium]